MKLACISAAGAYATTSSVPDHALLTVRIREGRLRITNGLRQNGYLLPEQGVSAILAQSNSTAAMSRPVAFPTKFA